MIIYFFSEVLRQETMGNGNTPLPLSQIVCRKICYDLTTYQKDEKYKLLPKDVIDMINKEAVFCIKNVGSTFS